jgi:hypothetical protein
MQFYKKELSPYNLAIMGELMPCPTNGYGLICDKTRPLHNIIEKEIKRIKTFYKDQVEKQPNSLADLGITSTKEVTFRKIVNLHKKGKVSMLAKYRRDSQCRGSCPYGNPPIKACFLNLDLPAKLTRGSIKLKR